MEIRKGFLRNSYLAAPLLTNPLTRGSQSGSNERNKKGKSSEYRFSGTAENRTRCHKWRPFHSNLPDYTSNPSG